MKSETSEPYLAHPERHSMVSVTDRIVSIVQDANRKGGWLLGFAFAFALVLVLFSSIAWLLFRGVGIWGVNVPVAWGFAIINFVWWIGIGHAGTLISAILLLFRQQWRTSINRFAEAMTLFALACAAIFPLIHLGRPYLFYWLVPYPNTMNLWPQFRSPLMFDFFAVTTYGIVSLLFWYIGLLPDLASLRDRAKSLRMRRVYGVMSLGWRNSTRHWQHYQTVYLIMAGLATPLVVSVHTIVSFDFAVAIVPGWHSTIFPPYFVAGAIYSGFSMVLSLLIPVRSVYGLKDFITDRHIDVMARVMLATGIFVAYGYLFETFTAFYSGNTQDISMQLDRMTGPYAPLYWFLLACNVVVPQLLWSKSIRASVLAVWLLAMVINVGMWLERFVIVITSLHRTQLPTQTDFFMPTFWDWSTFIGTIGLFLSLLYLFMRYLPLMAMSEVREMVSHAKEKDS
jgi:molybdopterin-containing oxidoreductase family membrane subunit